MHRMLFWKASLLHTSTTSSRFFESICEER
jgi:hypothetical protein